MNSKNKIRRNKIIAVVVIVMVTTACIIAALLFSGFNIFNIKGEADDPALRDSNIVQGLQNDDGNDTSPTPEPTLEPTPEPTPQVLSVKYSAVGDNLIHTNIFKQAQNMANDGEKYNFSYSYEKFKDFLSGFDINWINQETLVNDLFEPSGYPAFSSPVELTKATYEAGWTVYGLSNNHSYDKGGKGVNASLEFWKTMPEDVVTTGFYTSPEDDSSIALQEVNGISFAYLAYTEHTNGINPPTTTDAHVIYTSETSLMESQVKRARELADVVIVCVHWGNEDSHKVRDDQRELARKYSDWGADVIIGTHPHVIQEIEVIKNPEHGRNTLVAYSLGNFISTQNPLDNVLGLCLSFEVEQVINTDGSRNPISISNIKAYPVITHYEHGKTNVQSYLLRDYNDNLGAKHGMQNKPSGFGIEYIKNFYIKYISEEYLVLE